MNKTNFGDGAPTLTMQEMLAEMAQIRRDMDELAQLRTRMAVLEGRSGQPHPTLPDISSQFSPVKTTSRRRALGRIGGGLMAAGLGASLPVLSSSAAPQQPVVIGAGGPANGVLGKTTTGIDPNAKPDLAGDGSQTVTFAGGDFRPLDSSTTYNFIINGGVAWSGGGFANFVVRVDLPQAAKLTKLSFSFTDSDKSYNTSFTLYAFHVDTSQPSLEIKTLTSTGSDPDVQTLSFSGSAASPVATIDNSLYSYVISWYAPAIGNHVLWRAQISYVNVVGRFRAQ